MGRVHVKKEENSCAYEKAYETCKGAYGNKK